MSAVEDFRPFSSTLKRNVMNLPRVISCPDTPLQSAAENTGGCQGLKEINNLIKMAGSVLGTALDPWKPVVKRRMLQAKEHEKQH